MAERELNFLSRRLFPPHWLCLPFCQSYLCSCPNLVCSFANPRSKCFQSLSFIVLPHLSRILRVCSWDSGFCIVAVCVHKWAPWQRPHREKPLAFASRSVGVTLRSLQRSGNFRKLFKTLFDACIRPASAAMFRCLAGGSKLIVPIPPCSSLCHWKTFLEAFGTGVDWMR